MLSPYSRIFVASLLRCHQEPHGCMGCTANRRSVSREHGTTLPGARSRWGLWSPFHCASRRIGRRGYSDIGKKSLAELLRGASDRQYPTRMLRSRCRHQRKASASNPEKVTFSTIIAREHIWRCRRTRPRCAGFTIVLREESFRSEKSVIERQQMCTRDWCGMAAISRVMNNGEGQVLVNPGQGRKPYSINTPLTTSNFRIRANPSSQKTPINTMDADVFYLQSMFNFPSWTSRVRSPSPALNSRR